MSSRFLRKHRSGGRTTSSAMRGDGTYFTPTEGLVVESVASVEFTSAQWPIFDIDVSAINYPFVCSTGTTPISAH